MRPSAPASPHSPPSLLLRLHPSQKGSLGSAPPDLPDPPPFRNGAPASRWPQAAGLVLAPSALWISIATVLTWSIWAINTPRQPLFPRRGDGKSASFELPLLAQGKWQSAGPPKKKK